MKALRFWCVSSSLMIALTVGSFVTAQEKKADPAKPGDAKAAATAKKPGNRLPQNFAKLGLSEEQKTKIFAVQATYSSQIDDLEEKLKALKEKQSTEIEAVLLPDQAKQLADIRAMAKKKTAEKAKPATPAAGTTSPAAATEPAKKVEEPAKKTELPKKSS